MPCLSHRIAIVSTSRSFNGGNNRNVGSSYNSYASPAPRANTGSYYGGGDSDSNSDRYVHLSSVLSRIGHLAFARSFSSAVLTTLPQARKAAFASFVPSQRNNLDSSNGDSWSVEDLRSSSSSGRITLPIPVFAKSTNNGYGASNDAVQRDNSNDGGNYGGSSYGNNGNDARFLIRSNAGSSYGDNNAAVRSNGDNNGGSSYGNDARIITKSAGGSSYGNNDGSSYGSNGNDARLLIKDNAGSSYGNNAGSSYGSNGNDARIITKSAGGSSYGNNDGSSYGNNGNDARFLIRSNAGSSYGDNNAAVRSTGDNNGASSYGNNDGSSYGNNGNDARIITKSASGSSYGNNGNDARLLIRDNAGSSYGDNTPRVAFRNIGTPSYGNSDRSVAATTSYGNRLNFDTNSRSVSTGAPYGLRSTGEFDQVTEEKLDLSKCGTSKIL